MMMMLPIKTAMIKRARARDADNATFYRGQDRQVIARGLAHDLSHIPVVGHRDVGTETVASWDLRKTQGVAPTPTVYPEAESFRRM